MAPFALVESSSTPISFVSQSISWWTVAFNVAATLIVFLAGVTTIFMCACCGSGGQRKRLEEEQKDLDAAVLPPPEISSLAILSTPPDVQASQLPASEMPVAQSSKPQSRKSQSRKSPVTAKTRVIEKPPMTEKKLEQPVAKIPQAKTVFVADDRVKAYQTLCPADSAVFDKPGQMPKTGGGYFELEPKSTKFVPKHEMAQYQTLAMADSMIF